MGTISRDKLNKDIEAGYRALDEKQYADAQLIFTGIISTSRKRDTRLMLNDFRGAP